MTTEFRLLGTMKVSTNGEVYLLERHLARLRVSAEFFSFQCDFEKLRDALRSAPPERLRLLLSRDGQYDLDSGPQPADNPRHLKLSPIRVDSADPFLYHKTTRRGLYEAARQGCDAETDVILVNERGEVTETTIANIAVQRNGRWITPSIACGLLPGVMRAELLAKGELVEGVIQSGELTPGETIRCFNALRGTWPLKLL